MRKLGDSRTCQEGNALDVFAADITFALAVTSARDPASLECASGRLRLRGRFRDGSSTGAGGGLAGAPEAADVPRDRPTTPWRRCGGARSGAWSGGAGSSGDEPRTTTLSEV